MSRTIQDELSRVVEVSTNPGVSGETLKPQGSSSPQANLAGYAKEVERLCETLVGSLQQVSSNLDKYQPTEAESKVSTGWSYKDLKIAVKSLHAKLAETRRLAIEIPKQSI